MWTLLIVDDNKDNCDTIALALKKNKELEIIKSYNPIRALKIIEEKKPDIVISDLKMPDLDGISFIKEVLHKYSDTLCIILTAYGTIETAVEAIKIGAFDYLTKPINLEELRCIVNKCIEHLKIIEENKLLRKEVKTRIGDLDFVFESIEMKQIYDFVKEIAPTKSPVLILGESGVGKEIVARAIHKQSDRKDKPFLTINCAALSENLLESELFGYEKGAFTGANKTKKGFFEILDRGTLFLDEIGEMTPNTQSKILRVIEFGEFFRIGSTTPLKTDVRIIAATNKNLHKEVEKGSFRQDLYYRLNVFTIEIPPLRERKKDIPVLFDYFIEKFSKQMNKKLPKIEPQIYDILKDYNWPGNVRELKNLAEYLVVLNKEGKITKNMIPKHILSSYNGENTERILKLPIGTKMKEIEREIILKTLENCNFNRTKAAQVLGISRRTLIRKLQEFNFYDENE